MKRTLIVIFVFVLLLGVVGAATAADITLKLAHNQPKGKGYSEGVLLLEKLLREGTGGKVVLKEFADGVLGQERDTAEGLKLGTIEMAIISVGVMANYAPSVGIFNLPYLFDNAVEVDKLVNSEVAQVMKDEMLKKHGVRIIGFYSQGFRDIYSNVKIKSIDDLKGLKIRVPEAPVFVDTFKALGSSPTPIPWGELYTALETEVVEAYENTTQNAWIFNLYEVTKYMTKTGHLWGGGVLLISDHVFQKLSKEQQEVLVAAAERSATYHRLRTEAINAGFLNLVLESGHQMFTIEKAPLRKAVNQMYKAYGEKYGISELVEKAIKVVE